MAIFPHFLTYFITLFAVATTYMQLTSTERTQTLVTCMVGGTDPFCPSPGTYMAQGGAQNMAILGVKIGLLWQASHLITWENIYQGHLCPLNAPL